MLFVLLLFDAAIADETNIVYVPYESRAVIGTGGKEAYYKWQEDAARKLPECQSSEFDPKGNWGRIVSDAQVSLRFTTNVFNANDSIDALVILRNTGTNALLVFTPWYMSIKLNVTGENNKSLPPPPPPIKIISAASLHLRGHTQISFHINLNSLFDLKKPGVYHVTAEETVSRGNRGASSKPAEIRIESTK